MEENEKVSRFVYHRGMRLAELDERNQVTGSHYLGNGYIGGYLSERKEETIRSGQSDEKGSISKETGKGFTSGSDVDLISKERELCYYIRDEQGSVRYVVDQSGNAVNEYQYSAFGETQRAEEYYENRLRYNGQMHDGLTEQYYLRARYYQPKIGRFTQEDFLYEDGLNLYAYCKSNPIMNCDPSGLVKESVKCTTGQAERNCKSSDGSFIDLMETDEAERYENYWKQGTGTYQGVKVDGEWEKVIMDGKNVNTRQRMYTTPGVRSITDVKLGNTGEVYYRETIFDEFGRKIGHNDYTNHGRPDVLSHTNPHHHPNSVNDPSQHGKGVPGLHPNTPSKGGI